MSSPRNPSLRIWLAVLAGLALSAQLAWDYLHGGIPSHHLLNRADLPAISNLWGLLVLPLLVWWLVGRVQDRVARAQANQDRRGRVRAQVAIGFGVAALVGITLSIAFTQDAQSVASAIFVGTLLAALVLPVYRAECVLGFVLAMAFTFGPILPVLIASVIAALSYISTVYLFGALRWVVRGLRLKSVAVTQRV